MHFNYYFLRELTKSIRLKLVDKSLNSCFSQNKNELIFIFGTTQEFIIKAIFESDICLLTFPNEFKRARKNSINLFDEIEGQTIKEVIQYENERSLSIVFNNGFTLLFKLHGRRANICLFENELFHSMFKNGIKNDSNIILNELHRSIDQSDRTILSSGFNLKDAFPTFDKFCLKYLDDNDFEFRKDQDRIELLSQLIDQLNSKQYTLLEKDNGYPYISLLNRKESHIYTTDSIEACNLLAIQYFHVYLLKKEKENALSSIEKDIHKGGSYIQKTKDKLESLTVGVKNEEKANILMANLHIKTNHDNAIELFDFYRNENITIKIKPTLTLQANAQIFYRKAKNQKIELNKLKQNIQDKKNIITDLHNAKKLILETQNLKALRKLSFNKSHSDKKGTTQEATPYFEYVIDNFRVLVGKNAKANDQLLKQYASKEDLWLHARNVSGSHVVIKNPSDNISMVTIEKVAQVASWYSKGKNDTLCPVIFTKRKYVNKPKGAGPGKVVVQREEVILVTPCQNPQ
ncbi:MAG: putative ribosome quality control (RQC) complex YloA/Tae2 family protein [Cyclobacteriaceae bacterium]|jgi:predicted ribosome quality control (RQC) complex YloA/Tae2 family protein